MTNSPSNKQLKEFSLLIGFSFPILIGWFLPAVAGLGFRAWTLWLAIPILMLGLISPGLLKQPYRAWMAIGSALGWVNSHAILGIIFIVVLQPIAYAMRIFGHNPLRRQIHCDIKSYREKRTALDVDFNRIF